MLLRHADEQNSKVAAKFLKNELSFQETTHKKNCRLSATTCRHFDNMPAVVYAIRSINSHDDNWVGTNKSSTSRQNKNQDNAHRSR
jgi:hypothetical protein